jgi:hypothetical protein
MKEEVKAMRGLTHYHVCQYSVWCAACAAEAGLTPRSKDANSEPIPESNNVKKQQETAGALHDSVKAPRP